MNVFGPHFSPPNDLLLLALTVSAVVLMFGTPILVILGIRALWRAGSGKHRHRVEESLYYLSRAAWAIEEHLRSQGVNVETALQAHPRKPREVRKVSNSIFSRQ